MSQHPVMVAAYVLMHTACEPRMKCEDKREKEHAALPEIFTGICGLSIL